MPSVESRVSRPPIWVRKLARALVKLNHDPEWLATLRQRQIDGWSNGGCLIMAEAIRAALGPPARLVGIRERHGRRIEHVVAERDGWFADAYDVRSRADLLYDAETIGDFRDPLIVPFVLPADAARHKIPYAGHEDLVGRLRGQLAAALVQRPLKP